MANVGYPTYRAMTELVRNHTRVDEQLDGLLEDQGPDDGYSFHSGPTFWTDPKGGLRVTVIYKRHPDVGVGLGEPSEQW